jgi:VIT1/CCC1 family predicted Fe2+/Mn2+ transporter
VKPYYSSKPKPEFSLNFACNQPPFNNPSMHDHHEEEHFNSSEIVKDIVIGMADGLTVPFALAAGLSGAVDSNTIIITAGIAEIIAGSIAMGLGGYLAGKTESDHYLSELKREYDEVDRVPEREKQEIRDILKEYGISENTQELVTEELATNKDKWVQFMMRFELGLEEPHSDRARKSAFNIAASYIVGGLIPLSE